MSGTRHAQNGSIGTFVVVIVLLALAWWKWDWISSFLGSTLSMGGTSVELVDSQCGSGGRAVFDGHVRNTSDSPLELRATIAILDSSRQKMDFREATVRPAPLPPGQVGDFRGDGPPLPDGGSCKLDGFVDTATGRTVKHTLRGR
jgi:hypothetical protein